MPIFHWNVHARAHVCARGRTDKFTFSKDGHCRIPMDVLHIDRADLLQKGCSLYPIEETTKIFSGRNFLQGPYL